MQLDAALRSFLLQCADGDQVPLSVYYRATNPVYIRQYEELIEGYRLHRNITFLRQGHFRQDVLGLLAANADLRYGAGLYRRMARLHWRLGWLSQPLLRFRSRRYVLFLVDDSLFVQRFCLAEVLEALGQQPQAIGFSLRLGRNTTLCYTRDLPQELPEFTAVGEKMLRFDWRSGELDFGYPLEVSSSIYCIANLLPWLNRQRFANPNQLESRLAESIGRFTHLPYLLCYSQSVAFSNPVNQVAEQYQNRNGTIYGISNQDLAAMFSRGVRVDVSCYTGLIPTGCHQEVALQFHQPEMNVDGN
jgi:hypothetical protein